MFHRYLYKLAAVAVASAFLTGCVSDGNGNESVSQPVQNPSLRVVRVTAQGGNVAPAVTAFRSALGEPNNGAGAAAAFGRREINWDGVPAGVTNTNAFPQDFFNVNSTRGAVFSTPGTGFRVSDNNFADVDPSYANEFTTFSAPKSFAGVGSNVINVIFLRPGTQSPAGVSAFGAVFSDVDVAGATTMEFFDQLGQSMGTVAVPVRVDAGGLSFGAGAGADGTLIARVRIVLGTGSLALGNRDISAGGTQDLVVMDDWLYGEPQSIPFRALYAAGAATTEVVNLFRVDLGNPNNGAGASSPNGGRREVNWDAVPAGVTNTLSFPANFFSVNSTRGLVLSTPGTGFSVSDNLFSFIDPTYAATFRAFSAPKIFQAVGSTETSVDFLQAGTNTTAATSGFGAVFNDVDVAGSTRLEFLDPNNGGLGTFLAPVRNDALGFSFVGVHYPPTAPVRRVRITAGQAPLATGVRDVSTGGGVDLVILDDFLYGEPR